MQVELEIRQRGGLAATHELLRAGATSHGLTNAVRSGRIVRVRQGWYGLPDADSELESAVRVGGRATCRTAARHHGLWVTATATLHVRVPLNAVRLRHPSDHRQRLSSERGHVVIHWHDGGRGTRHVLSVADALEDLTRCASPELVVAAATSAIRSGRLGRCAWERIIRAQPRRLAGLLGEVDVRCESFLECLFLFRLRRLGYLPEVQVAIDGVGRVDIRLGRVIIELDGWEHHASREAFEEDRRRDAELAARGYVVLRFTYRMVTRRWQWVLGMIRETLDPLR